MSMSWYPGHDTGEGWEIAADNPGYGTLWIRTIGSDLPEWEADLAAVDVGTFLEVLTAHALSDDAGDPLAGVVEAPAPLPFWLSPGQARQLLPAFQKAVLLAGSGTDRYERLLPDDDAPPAEPLCVTCGKGTGYTAGETRSEWCEQYGHTPFGQTDIGWDAAVQLHAGRRAWWEKMQALREDLPAGAR